MTNITLDVPLKPRVSKCMSAISNIFNRSFSLFVLWIGMLFLLPQTTSAQEKSVYDVQNLKLDETNADGLISFAELIPHLTGIAKLRQHVFDNQELYPMEQKAVETSRNKKHEAHKRWERYMRKLPVYLYVVKDIQDYIPVTTTITKSFTVCQKFKDNLSLKIENINEYPVSAEIELEAGSLVNFPKSNKKIQFTSSDSKKITFNYIGNGRATFSMPPKSSINAVIPIVYSCDGQNGVTNKTDNNQILINHKINLVGYIYNNEKKELYRITSFPVTTARIKLAYL
ncbi:MAG: hypothetical protein AAF617_14635 [Bacteroidota bacterium]